MENKTKFVHRIFKSDSIQLDSKEKIARSTSEIEDGEILLVEHCYANEEIHLISSAIKFNTELYDNLEPIHNKWSEDKILESSEEMENHAAAKCQNNAGRLTDTKKPYFTIGNEINYFKDSKTPNAILRYMIDEASFECPVLIQYIISDRKINKDEDITVWYGIGTTETYKSNLERYREKYLKVIEKIWDEYIKSTICKQIILAHTCMYNGLYIVNGLLSISPRFEEYMRSQGIQCTIPNCKKWINKKVEIIEYILKDENEKEEYFYRKLGINLKKMKKMIDGSERIIFINK
jgi:hypothetical protein